MIQIGLKSISGAISNLLVADFSKTADISSLHRRSERILMLFMHFMQFDKRFPFLRLKQGKQVRYSSKPFFRC